VVPTLEKSAMCILNEGRPATEEQYDNRDPNLRKLERSKNFLSTESVFIIIRRDRPIFLESIFYVSVRVVSVVKKKAVTQAALHFLFCRQKATFFDSVGHETERNQPDKNTENA
jgi:hypothetical protein